MLTTIVENVACEHMSAAEVREALMKPGQAFTYHHGFLAADLYRSGSKKHENWSEMRTAASLVLRASEQGEAHLTQRRLDYLNYEYLCTPTRPEFRLSSRRSAKRGPKPTLTYA